MPSIAVDFAETRGTVSPRLYGLGFEHVGASVYGGLWVGDDGPATARLGWREDVFDLAKRLRPGVLRWPGGNFAQGYRWRDGAGARGLRPARFDYFWAKPEPNLVGTDEFLQFCYLVGAEPSITVNTRTGAPDDAAAWVEYCNGGAETSEGLARTLNGRADPYGVRLWALGSQTWEIGAEDAARRHVAFGAAMKKVDPSLELIAVGGNPANQNVWDHLILEHTRAYFDLLGPWAFDGVQTVDTAAPWDLHYANQAAAERLLRVATSAVQRLDELLPERPEAGVFFDGWGIWRQSRQGLQHDYHLGDGLVAAVVLHGLHRLAGRVRGAAWGNLVNALGVIQATERSCWTTPVFHVLKLLRDHHGDEVVRADVDPPTIDAPGGSAPVRSPRPPLPGMPLLDASATRDRARGRYTLSVVNRSYSDRLDVDLSLSGLPPGIGATAHTLNADDAFATNSAANPRRVEPWEFPIGQLPDTYSFPAHSLTVLVWEETPGLH
ncbi:MAG TPA: alpha-L-arabinofuranosidase C-terminal domain-containing protein [Chloroflexota bacterium]